MATEMTSAPDASLMLASKRVVYVGGLGEGVTQQMLRAAMIPFGPIKSVDIPMDYKVGKTRGFAFVEFHDPEDGKYIVYVDIYELSLLFAFQKLLAHASYR